MYDITHEDSFEELDYWIKTVQDILGKSPVYAIFGNKKDLYLNEKVDEEIARKKAEEIGAYFKLTSAKTERENINLYLIDLVNEYIKKNGRKNSTVGHREDSFSLQYKEI